MEQTLKNYRELENKYPWLDPRRVFGNSSGFYAALVISGVVSYAVARRLLEERSRIVRETEDRTKYPTTMVAVVGSDEQGVENLITPINREIIERNARLSAAAEKVPLLVRTNDNGPLAKVIGGPKDYMEFVLEKLGGKARQLNIPAYHHPVRSTDSVLYAKVVRDFVFGSPDRTLISSTNPRILQTVADIIEELSKQMVKPVELPKVAQYWRGILAAIDNGPGNTLQKLFSRIVGKEIPILSAEADQEKIADLRQNGKIS